MRYRACRLEGLNAIAPTLDRRQTQPQSHDLAPPTSGKQGSNIPMQAPAKSLCVIFAPSIEMFGLLNTIFMLWISTQCLVQILFRTLHRASRLRQRSQFFNLSFRFCYSTTNYYSSNGGYRISKNQELGLSPFPCRSYRKKSRNGQDSGASSL